MAAKKAFIWDLDGTLLDSYEIIVSSLCELFAERGIALDPEEVHGHAIRSSVSDYLHEMEEETGFRFEDMKARYQEISGGKKLEIRPFPESVPVLARLAEQGCEHFVFTHRGRTTLPVLGNTGLAPFFREVVSMEEGFPRKPAPDALLYLIGKYGLDPASTFYVGDRTLDMDCAKNAGIRGVLFLPEGSFCEPNGSEERVIRELWELTEE